MYVLPYLTSELVHESGIIVFLVQQLEFYQSQYVSVHPLRQCIETCFIFLPVCGMHVCMYTPFFMYVWVHILVYVHAYGDQSCCQKPSSISFLPYSLSQSLSTKPRAPQYGLSCKPACSGSPLSLLLPSKARTTGKQRSMSACHLHGFLET